MTYGSEYELEKIQVYYPSAKLVIRLKVNDEGSYHRLCDKFGVFDDDTLRT